MKGNEITLRPIEERDAENIVRWRNSDDVRRNLFSSLRSPLNSICNITGLLYARESADNSLLLSMQMVS